MNEMPPKKPYDTGYGKPPREKQFRPGQSGNPKGRPSKAKSQPKTANEMFVEQALTLVTVANGQGALIKMTTIEAVMAQIFRKAAAGDAKALRFIMANIGLLERAIEAAHPKVDAREEVRRKLAVLRERLAAQNEEKEAELAAGRQKPEDEFSA